ncbi:MAG: putative hydrolase [Eubacteriales bacterium]|nr:putative hydrolase [Eubacteriales bacterium]
MPVKAQGFTDFIVPNPLKARSRWQREKARNVNTKALIEAINPYPLDIVNHPDLEMPVDLEELVRAYIPRGMAMEINTGHRYNRREVTMAALKEEAEVVVNGDARFPETVGEVNNR